MRLHCVGFHFNELDDTAHQQQKEILFQHANGVCVCVCAVYSYTKKMIHKLLWFGRLLHHHLLPRSFPFAVFVSPGRSSSAHRNSSSRPYFAALSTPPSHGPMPLLSLLYHRQILLLSDPRFLPLLKSSLFAALDRARVIFLAGPK